MKAKKLVTMFSTTLVAAGLATAWAVASPLAAGCASAAPADQIVAAPTENAQFAAQVNELRRSQGLNALAVEGNLASIAQSWAAHMAENDGIFHRADLREGVTINWKRLGENVGMGPGVSDLMQAFIASPGHYKNLVDPTFTHIGIGTVRSPDGLLYTAHEFAAVEAAAAPRATAAPQPTAPRVTAPRATTPRAPRATAAPRATTPPPPPTTTTTEPLTSVKRSAAQQNELENGGTDDQQKQKDENEGGCRTHGLLRLVA